MFGPPSNKTSVVGFKQAALKSLLRVLINKFGIELINDKFAEIFAEECNIQGEYVYDDISEGYDNINNIIKLKSFRDKSKT